EVVQLHCADRGGQGRLAGRDGERHAVAPASDHPRRQQFARLEVGRVTVEKLLERVAILFEDTERAEGAVDAELRRIERHVIGLGFPRIAMPEDERAGFQRRRTARLPAGLADERRLTDAVAEPEVDAADDLLTARMAAVR